MSTVTVDKEADTAFDEKSLATVRTMISKAKANLVLQHPFFASLVLQRPLIETFGVPTAGADARGRIYYNPKFMFDRCCDVLGRYVFILAHEVMHIALLHCHKDTIGSRNPKACNVAMDKVINELLAKEKVGEVLQGALRHPGAENMRWQDLYNEDDQGDGGGAGSGEDLVSCPDGEPTGAEAEEIQAQTQVALSQAAQAARMQGKLPGSLARLVEDLLYVKTPWFEILERFMTGFTATDYSWRKPNRRFVGQGVYLPSLDREPAMGEVVIGVDTSGSIGAQELAVFGGHVNRILETCRPEKVHVVYCDSEVAHVDTVGVDELPIKLAAHGGGGTDLRNIFRYVAEQGITPDCCVVLTDGYTPYDDVPPDYPVVWLMTTDMSPPWGETVRYTDD